jgi:hypothetical protein
MLRHWTMGLLFAGAMAVVATPQTFSAQPFARNGYPQRIARNVYQTRGQMSEPTADESGQSHVEQLPPGRIESQPMSSGDYGDPFADEPHGQGGFPPYGHGDFPPYEGNPYGDCYGGSPACGDGCRESKSNWCCSGGQYFVAADYLYVQAGFSEALAFVDNQLTNGTTSFDHVEMEFDFTSSYRFGGGYRLAECGEEIRFLYTRLKSDHESGFTSEFVNNQPRFLIPFKPPQFDGGDVDINAGVDVKSFDWEWAKTIPLGCNSGCGCGDACGSECGGCGDPCGRACPLWDVSWSAGARYAEGDWFRSWHTFNTTPDEIGSAVSEMDFWGAGAKVGLEGRRYFFNSGWLSAYAKGDISLLWGEVQFDTVSRNQLDPNLPTETTVSKQNEQIFPVTEIEAGLSAQVTCNSRVHAGYLLSAWHDLGFRDDFLTDPQLTFPFFYDDANILGFQGVFVRAEFAY